MNFDLFNYPVKKEILPLRIPYMGSKNKIAETLLLKMLEINLTTIIKVIIVITTSITL